MEHPARNAINHQNANNLWIALQQRLTQAKKYIQRDIFQIPEARLDFRVS